MALIINPAMNVLSKHVAELQKEYDSSKDVQRMMSLEYEITSIQEVINYLMDVEKK